MVYEMLDGGVDHLGAMTGHIFSPPLWSVQSAMNVIVKDMMLECS